MKKTILIGFSWENISSKNLPQKNKTIHTFHIPEIQYSNQSQLKLKKKMLEIQKSFSISLYHFEIRKKGESWHFLLITDHFPRETRRRKWFGKWRISAESRTIGRHCFGSNSHNIHLFVKIRTTNYVMETNFRVIYLKFHAQMEKPQLLIMKEIELLQDF